ncbi:prolipoprotein [Mycoplasma mycoides subsp. mycoides]|uniref:lipoprotein n=1 Tax=Mycoplasma mycoides TaxID=2102 RepID=UPI000767F6BB|nr:lipoprotein [Mycoplasma mycoides]AME10605.1 prolipoprotein [Mycoplasma mycoides subsp. mycoides]AME11612.1 prolipoprotein [Mycoplasma mycoides subsp. mycoides]AME12640.1 prolipoprotein [Mycoplasma mycoides subsp. mycoides]AME13669.1 prolipoprotein [Mycoplasma mycoides subsp. mycoides]AME14663.1 prolipoprotein [Mycoplasma mycoides subsp. mycoides]
MKKLLTILGSIGLIATSGVAVVACNTSDKTKMPNENKGEEKVNLIKVAKQKDLGFISKKDNEIIKKAFIKQNSIDEKKVTVSVKGNGNGVSATGSDNNTTTNTSNGNLNDSAVIELKATNNGNETKTVTVIFEVNNNLEKLIQVKKLKGLADNKDDTILKAIDKLNPKSNLDTSKLSIERKDKKVSIKSSDSTYTGNPVEIEIESKVGVYVGLSLLSVALLASSGFIIYRSLKKKKK